MKWNVFVGMALFTAGMTVGKNTETTASTEKTTSTGSTESDGSHDLARYMRGKSTLSLPLLPLLPDVPVKLLNPLKEYDQTFVKGWLRVMRQLWGADGGANRVSAKMPVSSAEMLPGDGEAPHRAKRLIAYWTSVDCKLYDLKLHKARTLSNGHSNKVFVMEDRNQSHWTGNKDDNKYVLKTIKNPDAFYAELSAFQFLDHKIPYFGQAVCNRRQSVDGGREHAAIVFKHIGGPESLEYARHASLGELQLITAQLFLAIEHLHYLGIVHGDLKPDNVLVDKGVVKVIDLGFAAHLPHVKEGRGTHMTMAPELQGCAPGQLHEGVDWWAFGATVAMWYGAYFDEQNYQLRHNKASKHTGHKHASVLFDWRNKEEVFEFGSVPAEFPPALRSFLFLFFTVDSDARLFNTPRLLQHVRDHEFFHGVDWSKLYGGLLRTSQ